MTLAVEYIESCYDKNVHKWGSAMKHWDIVKSKKKMKKVGNDMLLSPTVMIMISGNHIQTVISDDCEFFSSIL